eukprot:TRINITY_DN2563_c0_g1_i2.p1 TRINITY_DN2563_c0_g1~~TRINITY_DN2563_c0_g1_i2.p1  ORF type:complete len:247 (-),score=12.63 TRINITY_DN2563_c0_g1_i2:411-1151(-)
MISLRKLSKKVNKPLRLIAPDLLGFGLSPWPSESCFSLQEHAACKLILILIPSVAVYIRVCGVYTCYEGHHIPVSYNPYSLSLSLGVFETVQKQYLRTPNRKVHIVGHSFGALVAIKYAELYPEHVASVILTSCPYFDNSEEASRYFGSRFPTNLLVHFPHLVWVMCQLVCLPTRRLFVPVAKFLLPQAWLPRGAYAYSDAFLHSFHSANQTFETIVHERVDKALSGVHQSGIPVTAVHGRCDEVS